MIFTFCTLLNYNAQGFITGSKLLFLSGIKNQAADHHFFHSIVNQKKRLQATRAFFKIYKIEHVPDTQLQNKLLFLFLTAGKVKYVMFFR